VTRGLRALPGGRNRSSGKGPSPGVAPRLQDRDDLVELRNGAAPLCAQATGQFLTVDPLAAATGARYAYAGGNPITGADPSGLDWYNPLTWTGDTYDNIALGATAVALVSSLLATGSAATVIGAPAAAVFGSVAVTAEGVAVVASIGGTVQHIREGDTTAAWISATGAIPGVGMAARWIYEARYVPRIAEVGIRTVGRGWRQLAQAVESGTLWGGGLGVWAQNVCNWCYPEYTL